jgi:hypothetical protein
VVGQEMYYTSIGDNDTVGFRIWKIDLTTGAITHVYDVPHFWVYRDGSVTTTTPTDFTTVWTEQYQATPHSMVVAGSTATTSDTMGSPRTTFLRGR